MLFGFFTPGPMEIGIIVFVCLLLFGPKQIPAISRAMGKIIPQFRAGMKEVEVEIAEGQKILDKACNGEVKTKAKKASKPEPAGVE